MPIVAVGMGILAIKMAISMATMPILGTALPEFLTAMGIGLLAMVIRVGPMGNAMLEDGRKWADWKLTDLALLLSNIFHIPAYLCLNGKDGSLPGASPDWPIGAYWLQYSVGSEAVISKQFQILK